MNGESSGTLTHDAILEALAALSDELERRRAIGEICLFGGTAMVLAFHVRISTKDAGAIFQPAQVMRDAARIVGEEKQLPKDWLNDGVKGFLSARHETTTGNLPQFSHLRLTMPVLQYLLAMKCMAARIGGTIGAHSDVPDIVFLIRHLELKSAEETLSIVADYYPAQHIPVKTRYLVEGIFEEELS